MQHADLGKKGQTTLILSYYLPFFFPQHLWPSLQITVLLLQTLFLNFTDSFHTCQWPQQTNCCLETAVDIQPILFALATWSVSPQKEFIWFTCWRSFFKRLQIEIIGVLCFCLLLSVQWKGPSLLLWSGVKMCAKDMCMWEWRTSVEMKKHCILRNGWPVQVVIRMVNHLSPLCVPHVGGCALACERWCRYRLFKYCLTAFF